MGYRSAHAANGRIRISRHWALATVQCIARQLSLAAHPGRSNRFVIPLDSCANSLVPLDRVSLPSGYEFAEMPPHVPLVIHDPRCWSDPAWVDIKTKSCMSRVETVYPKFLPDLRMPPKDVALRRNRVLHLEGAYSSSTNTPKLVHPNRAIVRATLSSPSSVGLPHRILLLRHTCSKNRCRAVCFVWPTR